MPNVKGDTIGRIYTLLAYDGTDFIPVTVDSDGHLQMDNLSPVDVSALATHAKQDTMITALQTIDDLAGALGSVNTDDIQVDVKTSGLPTGAATESTLSTMSGKLPSGWSWPYDALWLADQSTLSGVTTWTHTPEPIPSGEIWKITRVSIRNDDSVIGTFVLDDYDVTDLKRIIQDSSLEAATWHHYDLESWWSSGENPRVRFLGCSDGDTLYYTLNGVKYKVE